MCFGDKSKKKRLNSRLGTKATNRPVAHPRLGGVFFFSSCSWQFFSLNMKKTRFFPQWAFPPSLGYTLPTSFRTGRCGCVSKLNGPGLASLFWRGKLNPNPALVCFCFFPKAFGPESCLLFPLSRFASNRLTQRSKFFCVSTL